MSRRTACAAFLAVLFLAPAASAALVTYTSPTAFHTDVTVDYTWGFESNTPGAATDLAGPGSITLVQGTVTAPNSFSDASSLLDGQYIYINPQAADGDFTFDAPPADAFGISIVWFDTWNPDGVGATFYGASDEVLGTVTLTGAEALGSFLWDTNTVYEGFIGVVSTAPIARMKMTLQQAGTPATRNATVMDAAK